MRKAKYKVVWAGCCHLCLTTQDVSTDIHICPVDKAEYL